jgi:hypothetical protein
MQYHPSGCNELRQCPLDCEVEMKAIELTAVVGEDRKLTVQLPPDIAPGPHQVVVVVAELSRKQPKVWTMDDWPVHDAGLVDANFTMRREDLYGDDGR